MPEDDPLKYFPEVLEFRGSLSEETDRGCALMAAAYLSDQLERLLKHFFPKNDKSVEALFEPTGPLGSFSVRIDVAFACGLLPRIAQHDLHLIRRIRNDFGHQAKPLTFATQAIAGRCRELQLTFHERDAQGRSRFTNAALGVCAAIHAGLHLRQPAAVPKDPEWDEAKRMKARDDASQLAELILGIEKATAEDKEADA